MPAYPERHDDTIRLSALIELVGKYRDSQVILVDRVTRARHMIKCAVFAEGMLMLSTQDGEG